MSILHCPLARGPLHFKAFPPGSKSITNRALICAASAVGVSTLRGALDSEDTQLMMEALKRLGIPVRRDPGKNSLEITGCGGSFPIKNADIPVGNSGTTARFLTATLAGTAGGNYRIHGKPRMHERPIGDLINALKSLGADVRTENANGCPPVIIGPRGNFSGQTEVSGRISSQFLSALLMAAPLSPSGILIRVTGEPVSKPYIQMTLDVMDAFGVSVDYPDDLSCFRVPSKTRYTAREFTVEPDASAASYFFAAAAVTGGTVTVRGLMENSLQGDVAFCRCLEKMGCVLQFGPDFITVTGRRLHGIEVDMNAFSDTVMTLGAVALFAEGTTRITNVAHIRHKETDRLSALTRELRKLGAKVEEKEGELSITPISPLHGAEIETYDDHRMAMSFAVAGLNIPGVVLRNPGCVAKTYPRFFEDWKNMIRQNANN